MRKRRLEGEDVINAKVTKIEFRPNRSIPTFVGKDTRLVCPKCGRPMQKSGKKANSNGVIKQRYVCPSCKRKGEVPYNYFLRIDPE